MPTRPGHERSSPACPAPQPEPGDDRSCRVSPACQARTGLATPRQLRDAMTEPCLPCRPSMTPQAWMYQDLPAVPPTPSCAERTGTQPCLPRPTGTHLALPARPRMPWLPSHTVQPSAPERSGPIHACPCPAQRTSDTKPRRPRHACQAQQCQDQHAMPSLPSRDSSEQGTPSRACRDVPDRTGNATPAMQSNPCHQLPNPS
jgi:hypothetical protein